MHGPWQASLIKKTISKQIMWLVMPQKNRDLSEKLGLFGRKKMCAKCCHSY
jgi:hypothetical protein